MAGTIGPVQTGQNAMMVKRAQLEAQVAAAISRAQKQYIQVQQPVESQPAKGPSHLGTKVYISV